LPDLQLEQAQGVVESGHGRALVRFRWRATVMTVEVKQEINRSKI
jgi:hypothetical protein